MSRIAGLYVLIDPTACRGRRPVDVARAALAGGASMIQWRDKLRDKGEQLADARLIYDLCLDYDAFFISNDHVDLALALVLDGSHNDQAVALMYVTEGASIGVHVGQKDLPLTTVRSI